MKREKIEGKYKREKNTSNSMNFCARKEILFREEKKDRQRLRVGNERERKSERVATGKDKRKL